MNTEYLFIKNGTVTLSDNDALFVVNVVLRKKTMKFFVRRENKHHSVDSVLQ